VKFERKRKLTPEQVHSARKLIDDGGAAKAWQRP
jgi:hypothetical protein